MSRSSLRILAVILTTLIIVVLVSALDHLPGGVRTQIDAERTALQSTQAQIKAAQSALAKDTATNAAFFGAIAASRQWPVQFQKAPGELQSAQTGMDRLSELEKHGHYRDRPEAERLLREERNERSAALNLATAVPGQAAAWLHRKQQLPSELQRMEQDYQKVHAFNLSPVISTISRAEADWPDKKADLESRLGSVRGIVSRSDQLWQSTASARSEAAAGKIGDADAGALLTAADELDASASELPRDAAQLQSLTGQLYDSWDKILVDMEVRGLGDGRKYDQKIRTVRTHDGTTTSEEQWVSVSPATYDAMHNDLGMAIEQKPAGKYDSEAEHVPQPAGFAYMAPPSQGSNQYGYWDHRDGQSFWVFYGKYALLRDLLFNHDYRPLSRGDWDGYRAERSQGRTYYGQGAESSAQSPKYGTSGTTTQERYAGSSYAKSGGFRDSPYASSKGSYRDSPYATPMARDREADRTPRTFGHNARPEEPRAPPEHSYRPAPSHSPRHFSSGGGGRRFGRRGR